MGIHFCCRRLAGLWSEQVDWPVYWQALPCLRENDPFIFSCAVLLSPSSCIEGPMKGTFTQHTK